MSAGGKKEGEKKDASKTIEKYMTNLTNLVSLVSVLK